MRRAAEKAGFAFEGVMRGFWRQDDGIEDYAMYGRTLADHRGQPGGQTGGKAKPWIRTD